MPGGDTEKRPYWLSVLAKARLDELDLAIKQVGGMPTCKMLRVPEVGLVMARGRAGGSGQRFNLGEVPVTRCAVQSPAGDIGHGYVQGRDKRHAELAATMDALLQDETHQPSLLKGVIEPLANAAKMRRAEVAGKAEATRVEFFTMVRGEG